MAVWKLIRVINKGVTASPGGINNLLVKVPSGELIFKSPEVVHTPEPPLSAVEIKVDGAAASTIIVDEPWYRYNQDEAFSSQLFSLVIQKVCFDPVRFSEALLKNITTRLIDTPKATDDFLGVANTDDDQTASVAKVLSETMSVGELVGVSWIAARGYQDSLNKADDSWRHPNKGVADAVGSTSISTFIIDPTWVDLLLPVEAVALDFAKPLVDSFNKTDSSWRHPNKGVADVVGSATSISTFIIDPTWVDLLLPVEAVALDFARPLEDYFTRSETQSNGVGKVAADTATSSDGLILICDRGIVDMRPLVDLYSMLIAKTLADTVSDSEAVALDFAKPLEDYFTRSETSSNGVNKVAADAATSSEGLIFICGRDIVDLRSLVDLYSVLIDKVLVDTVSDSEAVSRNASKVSADTASSSDSGQLIQHTYAPIDYFADVYVGTISNF